MKKIFTLIFVNMVLALLQTAFFPVLFGKSAYINWVLATGLAWLLVDAPLTALKSVFIGGILLDTLMGTHLGVSSLIMTTGVYTLILIRKYLFRGLGPHMFVGSITSYIYIVAVVHRDGASPFVVLFVALVTSILSILISKILNQIVGARR